jgi:hypothetical protein
MATVIEEIPLAKDSHGVYRVGGTRVTLDLVVRAFNRGATAEEIVQKFPPAACRLTQNSKHPTFGAWKYSSPLTSKP